MFFICGQHVDGVGFTGVGTISLLHSLLLKKECSFLFSMLNMPSFWQRAPFSLFFRSHHLSFRNSHVTFLTYRMFDNSSSSYSKTNISLLWHSGPFLSVTDVLSSLSHPFLPSLHPKQLPVHIVCTLNLFISYAINFAPPVCS